MAARRALIAGNWKMHGRRADLREAGDLIARLGPRGAGAVSVLICPPMIYLEAAMAAVAASGVAVGAQDCSPVAEDAARTGEVSAAMLADAGVRFVIVGHSERRTLLGETDDLVRRKAEAALAVGVTPIICVGESQSEREAGREQDVVAAQIRASVPAAGEIVVAYEPVWAIGGSRTPTPHEIAAMHSVIRRELGPRGAATRILYGGSVNAKNAAEIFGVEGVDGALVGRACLKAADFAGIIQAHPAVV
ncbi:MAG: triose-phosphate isomerase [Hyphomonadaceae bacterium]|nr:triose-phosphate isomerase [Hyphomonadaceae bacterium]